VARRRIAWRTDQPCSERLPCTRLSGESLIPFPPNLDGARPAMVLFPAVFFGAVRAAFLAGAVDLKGVAGGEIAVFVADFLLQPVDLLGKEFDGTAALGANHVVMAAAVVLVLVARDTVVESDFAGQAAFRQQFQRPVDGGIADACVLLLDQAVKFVGGKMIPSFEKSAKDGVTLSSLLQTDALEMAMKNILRLADHLARERGLVIDALLQHGSRATKRLEAELDAVPPRNMSQKRQTQNSTVRS
jgi:hypothetical protein